MTQIIFNGGDLMQDGYPANWNWDTAKLWQESSNPSEYGPQWRFDCGFKLDYDGPIISVSSRFYPPAEYYGPKWDGDCNIMFFGKVIRSKSFACDTLDILKSEVEAFIQEFKEEIKSAIPGAAGKSVQQPSCEKDGTKIIEPSLSQD